MTARKTPATAAKTAEPVIETLAVETATVETPAADPTPAVTPDPAPETPAAEPKADRIERYPATKPDGSTVTVEHNIDTGSTRVLADDES